MKITKCLRPHGLHATLGLFAGVILYTACLLDTHLRYGFEMVASRVNGGRVEAHSLKTHLFTGRFEMSQLHITNPFNPTENLIQIEQITGKLLIGPLLRRKLVIDHMNITGARLFIERGSYGGIEETAFETGSIFERMAPGFASPALAQIAQGPLRLLGQVATGIDIKGKLEGNLSRLGSFRRLEELRGDISALSKMKEELLSSAAGTTVGELGDRIQRLKAARAPSSKLSPDTWSAIYQEAKAALGPLNMNLEQTQSRFDRIHQNLDTLVPFIEADVAELKSQMKLPRLDRDDLSSDLFSPTIMSALDRLAYWLNMGRRRMPTGSKLIVRQEQSRGQAIHFGKDGGWPAVLVGAVNFVPSGRGDSLEGTLTGLTSDPPLYGAPLILNLKVSSTGSKIEDLKIGLLVDHRMPTPNEILDISFQSVPIGNVSLNEGYDLRYSLASGKARGKARLRIEGERLEFDWDTQITDATFQVNSRHRQIQSTIEQASKPMRSFTLTGRAEGPFTDVGFTIRSELGKRLAEAIRRDFRHSIDAIDDTLKMELLDYFDPKRKSLQYELSTLERLVVGELDDRLSALRGIANLAAHHTKKK